MWERGRPMRKQELRRRLDRVGLHETRVRRWSLWPEGVWTMYCTQRLRLSQALFQVRCGRWQSWLLLAPYKWSQRRRNFNPRLNSVHLGLQDRLQIQPTLGGSVSPAQTIRLRASF